VLDTDLFRFFSFDGRGDVGERELRRRAVLVDQ
jgi:hypothetical protein